MFAIGRFLSVAVAFALIVGCATPPEPEPVEPPDTRAEDEATIRSAIEAWAAAAEAKDIDAFVSVYAEDGVVMLGGAPDMSGVEAIRGGIGGLMEDPNFALTFDPDAVVVARSGDMAYELGPYSLTLSDADGNPVTEQGRYVVVWGKRNGEWKVLIDAPLSDPPAE